MRLHDGVVKRLRRIDVVVVGIDASVPKALGLTVLEEAETGADLNVRMLILEPRDDS